MKYQSSKKIFAFIIVTLLSIYSLQAQCLVCKGTHVSMQKCIPGDGSSCGTPGWVMITACVTKKDVAKYQAQGWGICYDGPGFLSPVSKTPVDSLDVIDDIRQAHSIARKNEPQFLINAHPSAIVWSIETNSSIKIVNVDAELRSRSAWGLFR